MAAAVSSISDTLSEEVLKAMGFSNTNPMFKLD
jgi:hypothetical protein